MTTSNYQCEKCSALVQSDKTPAVFNCPDGGHHKWTNLGKTGTINFQCSKCSTLLKAASQPAVFGCPDGSHHRWTKL